jgi:hypothetical protein
VNLTLEGEDGVRRRDEIVDISMDELEDVSSSLELTIQRCGDSACRYHRSDAIEYTFTELYVL